MPPKNRLWKTIIQMMEKKKFSLVSVDEAAQIPEEQAQIFLAKGTAQCVLIGDHQQLKVRQTVPEAERLGIQGLYVRLLQHIKINMLKEYRRSANQTLIRLVSKLFYGDELIIMDAANEICRSAKGGNANRRIGRRSPGNQLRRADLVKRGVKPC